MIIYGKQVFLYVLQHHSTRIKRVILQRTLEPNVFAILKKLQIKIERVDPKKAQALARGGNHQGYLMEVYPMQQSSLQDILNLSSILLLEGVSDTHNIGAIFRSVYCLGFEAVLLTQIASFSIEGAIRTSSGALLDVPFLIYQNSLTLAHELKMAGFTLYGAVVNGADLRGSSLENLAHKKVLCLGCEGTGLRKRMIAKMDHCVSIALENNFNSLNIGIAAAILMDRMQHGRR